MLISIVIPAYNEEKRIGKTLQRIYDFYAGKGREYEVILVDDGSGDGTVRVAHESRLWRESALKVVENKKNRGKGFSAREGMKAASGEYILFTDADLSAPIEEIEKLESAIHEGADIAIGSRSMPGSDIKIPQPVYRMIMGRVFNKLVRILLIDGFNDTQCGFKLLRSKCVKDILPDLRVDGFSFDVEILYLARKKGYSIKEIPVVWSDFRGSTVHPIWSSARMFFELLYIKSVHG